MPKPKPKSKPASSLASSLKQLGDIQVNEWDFMALLNKDINEVEISHSLRKLGNIRVMEWDFRTVLPAVNKLAHQEVDLVDLVRRTARYKVLDWDFRSAPETETKVDGAAGEAVRQAEMQALTIRLKDFLQYVVVHLIDEPNHAQIKVLEIAPRVLRFKLVLLKRDMAMLIGTEGHTAAAIRNLLKAAAAEGGAHALLMIVSHEEEISRAPDRLDFPAVEQD